MVNSPPRSSSMLPTSTTSPSRSPGRSKSAAFQSAREMWNQRERVENISPLVPQSPTKKKQPVKASVSENVDPSVTASPSKKKKGKKKLYFPANSPVPTKSKVASASPLSRSKSMGAYITPSKPQKAQIRHAVSMPVRKSVVIGSESTNMIYEIETIDELPDQIKSDLWYSGKEFSEIKRDYEAVLFLLDTGKPILEEENSARGLQKRTEDGAWQLFESQRNARNAVFKLQDIQRKEKRSCAVEIANAYAEKTAKDLREAQHLAEQDAQEIQEFLFERKADRSKRSPKLKTSPKTIPQKEYTGKAPITFNDSFCTNGALSRHRHGDDDLDAYFTDKEEEGSVKSRGSKSSQGSKKRKRKKRKLRFKEKPKYIKPKKVKDYQKAMDRRWLTKKELKEIEFDYNMVLDRMERKAETPEESDSRRGLEKSTEQGAMKLFKRRQEAVDIILFTQDQQRRLNYVDSEELSNVYFEVTKEARREALKFGKQDAKEAKKYRLRRRTKTSDEDDHLTCTTDESGDEEKYSSRELISNQHFKVQRRSSCSNIPSRAQPGVRVNSTIDTSDRSLLDLSDKNEPVKPVTAPSAKPVLVRSATNPETPDSDMMSRRSSCVASMPSTLIQKVKCEDTSERSLLDLGAEDDGVPQEKSPVTVKPKVFRRSSCSHAPIRRTIVDPGVASSHAPSRRNIFAAAAAYQDAVGIVTKSELAVSESERCGSEKKSQKSRRPFVRKQVSSQPSISWLRTNNKSSQECDLSESASMYEGRVTEIVNTSFDEPEEIKASVVEHLYASNAEVDVGSVDEAVATGNASDGVRDQIEEKESNPSSETYPSEEDMSAGTKRPYVATEENQTTDSKSSTAVLPVSNQDSTAEKSAVSLDQTLVTPVNNKVVVDAPTDPEEKLEISISAMEAVASPQLTLRSDEISSNNTKQSTETGITVSATDKTEYEQAEGNSLVNRNCDGTQKEAINAEHSSETGSTVSATAHTECKQSEGVNSVSGKYDRAQKEVFSDGEEKADEKSGSDAKFTAEDTSKPPERGDPKDSLSLAGTGDEAASHSEIRQEETVPAENYYPTIIDSTTKDETKSECQNEANAYATKKDPIATRARADVVNLDLRVSTDKERIIEATVETSTPVRDLSQSADIESIIESTVEPASPMLEPSRTANTESIIEPTLETATPVRDPSHSADNESIIESKVENATLVLEPSRTANTTPVCDPSRSANKESIESTVETATLLCDPSGSADNKSTNESTVESAAPVNDPSQLANKESIIESKTVKTATPMCDLSQSASIMESKTVKTANPVNDQSQLANKKSITESKTVKTATPMCDLSQSASIMESKTAKTANPVNDQSQLANKKSIIESKTVKTATPVCDPSRSASESLVETTTPLHDPSQSASESLVETTAPLHDPSQSASESLVETTAPLHDPSQSASESLVETTAPLHDLSRSAGEALVETTAPLHDPSRSAGEALVETTTPDAAHMAAAVNATSAVECLQAFLESVPSSEAPDMSLNVHHQNLTKLDLNGETFYIVRQPQFDGGNPFQ